MDSQNSSTKVHNFHVNRELGITSLEIMKETGKRPYVKPKFMQS